MINDHPAHTQHIFEGFRSLKTVENTGKYEGKMVEAAGVEPAAMAQNACEYRVTNDRSAHCQHIDFVLSLVFRESLGQNPTLSAIKQHLKQRLINAENSPRLAKKENNEKTRV